MSAKSTFSYADEIQGWITDMGHAGDTGNHEEASAPTVLELLNEDCWRLVLDHVPVRDIMRSERVSRRWQAVVHRYLQEAGVCLESASCRFRDADVRTHPKNRVLTIRFVVDHEEMRYVRLLDKWGPYVVYSYCPTRRAFEKIVERCDNLKSLAINMFYFRSGDLSSSEQVEFVERLERIVLMDFTGYDNIQDSYDISYADDYNWVYQYENVQNSRGFWPSFKPTTLKSLTVRGSFDFSHFLSAVGCFPVLVELNLQGELKNIHLLLEKTPVVEQLCLMNCSMPSEDRDGDVSKSLQNVLSCLKCLTVYEMRGTGWWLQAAVRGCKELRSLRVCWSVYDNLVELCRMIGQTLEEVWVTGDHHFLDDDMADIIAACPNLTTLDVRFCYYISDALVGKAARAARGRLGTLRLRIAGTAASSYSSEDTQTPGLIVDRKLPRCDMNDYMDASRPRQYIQGI